jgi:hypothetical protein
MDNLTEAGRATILREFYAREAELRPADGSEDHTWRWAEGAILFPEGRCPLCQEPMRSNRIWLIQEGARQLLGQRKLEGGRLVVEEPRHPHANGTDVCTGSVFGVDGTYRHNDVVTALFFGINLLDCFWGKTRDGVVSPDIPPWLEDFFDHLCGHPEHTTAPERCVCERHRIERGELVRCDHCKLLYPATEQHTEHRSPNTNCGCGCRCIPGAYRECSCGHAECWCTNYGLSQPCNHRDPRYCESRNCEQEWFDCDYCEYSLTEQHTHNLQECDNCSREFEYIADSENDGNGDPYGGYLCTTCGEYRCYNCMSNYGHYCEEEEDNE